MAQDPFPKSLVRVSYVEGAWVSELRVVADADEEAVAEAEGFVAVTPVVGMPLPREFPKMLYHADIGQRIALTADEEAALQAVGGWSDVPVEAQPK